MPCWFSPITVRNQPKNMQASSTSARRRTAQPPAQSLRYETAPSMSANSATEPMIGHGLPCGT